MTDRRAHWENVYTKPRTAFSWFEEEPTQSVALVMNAMGAHRRHVIDIGGGDSPLAARLIDAGVQRVTVLDISQAALDRGRALFGDAGGRIHSLRADVTEAWSIEPVNAWHDRAIFHFLTEDTDRARYCQRATQFILPGGALVVSTFADDGPERCSGLPVRRYNIGELAQTFGPFVLEASQRYEHHTPSGGIQAFTIATFRKPEVDHAPC
jgi:SAM-dependent methyltransferase